MVNVNGIQLFRHSNPASLEDPFFYARIPIPDGETVNIRTPGGGRSLPSLDLESILRDCDII